MTSSLSRIQELAQIISTSTAKVDAHIKEHGLPQPSFKEDGPLRLDYLSDGGVATAHNAAIEATIELHELLLYPEALFKNREMPAAMHTITTLGIPGMIAPGTEITYADLSKKCGIEEPRLKQIIRYAIIQHRVFREDKPNTVSHSAVSRLLAEDVVARDYAEWFYDEMLPCQAGYFAAMKKWPNSQEPNETGFNIANNIDLPFYEGIAGEPRRVERFATAMFSLNDKPDYSYSHLANSFPWGSLAAESTVVDMGGSNGAVSFYLARQFTQLRFVSQDLPSVIEAAEVPKELQDRVSLAVHDFMTPQTTVADVYMVRHILHNWPDKYAVKFLQNLIPTLRPGAKVLLNEVDLPRPGSVPLMEDRDIRMVDSLMFSNCNSRERDLDDWRLLVKQADPRFNVKGATRPPGSALSVVEVDWTGV